MQLYRKAIDFSSSIMARAFAEGDIVVDATVGQGRDTIRLAGLVGQRGKVFGFDVQKSAIEQTLKQLQNKGLASRVELFPVGHENLRAMIPAESHGQLAGVVFNLGFLPGGDKSICTQSETSVHAISQACSLIRSRGVIIITGYTGHPGGESEVEHVLRFASALDQTEFSVIRYQLLNQINHPPQSIIIYKN